MAFFNTPLNPRDDGGARVPVMAKGQVTRRQKDISRVLREKKKLPPLEKFRPKRKEPKR